MNASPYRGSSYGRESLIVVSFRSFLVAIFGIIGLCFGFFIALLLIGSITSSSAGQAETYFTPQIVPNAEGDRTAQSSRAPVILKLNVVGVIGAETLNMHTVRQLLVESREGPFKDDRVKAILIHIESPGGTVVDSDGIYRALLDYKARYKVPVYAFVDGLCASGGMYVASAADKIFASNVSLIGSVGVLSPPFFNFVDLMQKLGVDSLTLTAGKDKDALSPFRKWRADEDENLKAIIEYYYNDFVGIVLKSRPHMDRTKLVDEYGAHIFPAAIAKEYGYIDQDNATINEVILELAKKIGIDNNYYQVIELTKKNWFAELVQGRSTFFSGEVTHKLDLPAELDPKLMNQFLYLYHPGT